MLNESVALKTVEFPLARAVVPADASAEHSLAGAFSVLGAVMRFERNAEIYGEAEPADYFYQVINGAVRNYKVFDVRPPSDRRLSSPRRCVWPRSGR